MDARPLDRRRHLHQLVWRERQWRFEQQGMARGVWRQQRQRDLGDVDLFAAQAGDLALDRARNSGDRHGLGVCE